MREGVRKKSIRNGMVSDEDDSVPCCLPFVPELGVTHMHEIECLRY